MLKISGQKTEPKKKTLASTLFGDADAEIKKFQQDFFVDFPKTPYKPLEYYVSTDSLKRCEKSGSKKVVEYRHNDYGYRCSSFDETADVKILTLGCSWVYGVGLNQEFLYHEIIADRIRETGRSVINWNLALPSRSNDYIARTTHLAMDRLCPDLVLVNFTRLSRREYFTVNGECLSYHPGSGRRLKSSLRLEHKHLFELTSDKDDFKNFWLNFRSIKAVLQNVDWFWSSMDSSLVDDERYVGLFKRLDIARDESHPSIISNKRMADLYWDKISVIYT
tara:strand:+ start:1886 stop:2719 length:834 start_codon:yes stop_codon:yes gene_type:complete